MEILGWRHLVTKIYNFWSYVRSSEISFIGTAMPIYIPLYTNIKSVMMTSWCSTSLTVWMMAKKSEKPSIFPMISTFYFQGFHFWLKTLELKKRWCWWHFEDGHRHRWYRYLKWHHFENQPETTSLNSLSSSVIMSWLRS